MPAEPLSTSLAWGIAPPGFRLPEETRIGRVRLQVSQLQRSVDYYEAVLGLRVAERAEGAAVMTAQGDDRPLVELRERRGVAPVPRRGAYGLYHFALLLPARAALGQFIAHLAQLSVRFGTADHLVSEALYLTDPDGLGIEVYVDRTRDTWQHRGRELAMTTEPLDLESLVDIAGDTTWSGAPAGTTMGHVHLHVGDLEQSEAFYPAALGFDKTAWGYPGALFLAAGGYHHHLGTNTWSRGPSATDTQARLLDWELRLPGQAAVDAAVESLRLAGHPAEPVDGDWLVADPWGTRVRLIA